MVCPQVFASDGHGYAVVMTPEVATEVELQVRLAEADCLENAIMVSSTPGKRSLIG